MDYPSIIENYKAIRSKVDEVCKRYNRNPDEVRIISVSKINPFEKIEYAFKHGINGFGENYVQELKQKFDLAETKGIQGIDWHLIGHLQTNKVKYIAGFVKLVHSVDSIKLALELQKHAEKNNRIIDILIQVNTSQEESKSGCNAHEVQVLLGEILKLKNINTLGLMTIAGLNEDIEITRKEFKLLKSVLDDINKTYKLDLKELSMGMSGDFEAAIEEGSTMLRIGTSIFGERNYGKN